MNGRLADGVSEFPGASMTTGFAAVIDLTHAMLSAARRAEWDAVAQIETVRGDALADCFAGSDMGRDGTAIAEAVRTLRALDTQITVLATEAMADLQQKMRLLRTGSQALRAYESASTD